MSAQQQLNQMRLQALMAMGKFGSPKLGLVTEYDDLNYAVKVMIQPEAYETGWVPILSLMAGNGFGIFAGPLNGSQAVVLFQENDREAGVCIGFIASQVDLPPQVPAGEIHAIHKSGSFLKFLTDGTISIEADAGILSKGPWTHTGTLHTTQDITCDTTVTATTDVIGGGKHLKTHVHSGVQGGSSNTGTPV